MMVHLKSLDVATTPRMSSVSGRINAEHVVNNDCDPQYYREPQLALPVMGLFNGCEFTRENFGWFPVTISSF